MRLNKTEPRASRPGLLVVLIAVAMVVMTIWFRESESGPIHRVRRGVHAVAAPVSAVGEFVTQPLRGFFAWASDLGVSRSQLAELRTQNEQLRTRVAELEEARLENERLRALVKLDQAKELQSVAARVIGRPTGSWEGVITVDRGTKDGVTTGMPVLGPRGLLGQTVEVTKSSARVRLITDQRSGVAAMVHRTRAVGIVHGSIEGNLTLDFVSQATTVTLGDVVLTSGLGGVYPKGIVIGEVLDVDRRGDNLHQRIRVQPRGDVTALEEVLIVVGHAQATEPRTGGE